MGTLISGIMQAGGNVAQIIRTDPAKAARQAADAVIVEVKTGKGAVQGRMPGVMPEGRKKTSAGAEAESTAINTDPMQHTPAEQAIIEEYQQGTDEVLKDTFESYFDNPKQGFSRHNISNVSERQASDAGKLLGGEYKGYKNAINSNGIRHILNEHGPNGSVDNSLSDMNDVARMGYVIDNYDAVEVVTYQSGDVDLSREFRMQDNKPAPMLKYSKKVNGTYYVVEAIPESKHKKFWVVSAYMQKADSGTQAPDANGPENTPKASLASSLPVSNTNVPHRVPGVNGQYLHNAPSVFLSGSGLEGTWTVGDRLLPVDEKLAQTSRWLLPVEERGQKSTAFGQARAESTSINTDLEQHTAAEQTIIEEYQAASRDDLRAFYDEMRSKENQNDAKGHFRLKDVSVKMASDVKELTGKDIAGFKAELDGRQAWHISNDHGENGKADHSMADANDVARMQYVLDNYDFVSDGGTTDAYWEPNPNYVGKQRQAQTVVFGKKVNGTYYVVEALPITKNKTVKVVSAYMLEEGKVPPGKIGKKSAGQPSRLPDANAPWFTAKTDSASSFPASNPTVPQAVPGVNRQYSHNAPSVFLPGSGLEGTWTAEDGLLPVDEKLAKTSRWLLPLDEKLAERSMLPLSEGVVRMEQTAVENRATGEYTWGEGSGHGRVGEGESVSESEFEPTTSDEATERIAEKRRKLKEVQEKYGLTEDEVDAVIRYKTALSYTLNARLREGLELDELQETTKKHLDTALPKLPKVGGTLYRTLTFDDVFNPEEEYNDFLFEHQEGKPVFYQAYTSTSVKADGHPFAEGSKYSLTLEIKGYARDLEGFGNNFENEALYERNAKFIVTKVTTDKDGYPYIYMEEVAENGTAIHPEERGAAVRDVQEPHSVHDDLQGVPEGDSGGTPIGELGSQGELSGGQRDSVRSGESGEAGGTPASEE